MFQTYTCEPERIWGMTEGNHSAPILASTGRQVESIQGAKEPKQYFYRDQNGNPTGPGEFRLLPNGEYALTGKAQIDIF